jgi:hypothetical protein
MSTLPVPPPSTFSSPTADAIHQLELMVKDAIPAIVQRARAAWRDDLPKLLATNRGQWVAYRGERQVGIGRTKTQLVQQCLRAGLSRGEFLVLRIEPEMDQQVTVPVDI